MGTSWTPPGVDYSEAAIRQLDAAIAEALPATRRTEKAYYITTREPDFQGYRKIAETIIEAMAIASGARASDVTKLPETPRP